MNMAMALEPCPDCGSSRHRACKQKDATEPANALMEEWGYISRSSPTPHKIGDRLSQTWLWGPEGSHVELNHEMVVTGYSHAEEWMEQHRYIGGSLPHPPYMYFYRTVAE